LSIQLARFHQRGTQKGYIIKDIVKEGNDIDDSMLTAAKKTHKRGHPRLPVNTKKDACGVDMINLQRIREIE